MPLRIGGASSTQLRCDNCGRVIAGEPIMVKTCCVNRPWVFCSEQCMRQFTSKWMMNQEAGRGGALRRGMLP